MSTRKRSAASTSSSRARTVRRTSYKRPPSRASYRRPAARRAATRSSYRPAARSYTSIGRSMGSSIGGLLAPGIVGRSAGGLAVQSGRGRLSSAPTPSFGKGCVRVKHREFVTTVYSSVVFQNSLLSINPGDSLVFPWLSQIAVGFEMYKFHGLVFEFVSTSGSAVTGTNPGMGELIMATDYNARDPPFISKQQMFATEFSNAGPPHANLIHAVECAPAENPLKWLYVRSGATTNGGDLRFSDLGRFQLATLGMQQAGNAIGDLWVSYDVTLCKPTIQFQDEQARWYHGVLKMTGTGGPPFGNGTEVDNWTPRFGSILVVKAPTDTRLSIDNLEPGQYLLTLGFFGTANNWAPPTPSITFGDASIVNDRWGPMATFDSQSAPQAVSGITNATFTIFFKVNSGSFCNMDFTGGTYPGSLTNVELVIVKVPDNAL